VCWKRTIESERERDAKCGQLDEWRGLEWCGCCYAETRRAGLRLGTVDILVMSLALKHSRMDVLSG